METIVANVNKIYDVIRHVAAEQDRRIVPLTDNTVFMESGLDSLCFAIIVARLEDELGLDPFTATEDIQFPPTLGEFVKLYEHAAQ